MPRAILSTEIKYVDNRYVAVVGIVSITDAAKAALSAVGDAHVDIGGTFDAAAVTVDGTASPAFTLASEIVRFPADFARVKTFDATDDNTAWLKAKAWTVVIAERISDAVTAAEVYAATAAKVVGTQHINI